MIGRLLILAVLLAGTAGCGQPRSRVHGTVTYQSKPLSEGTVIFIASDNMVYPTSIGTDGKYDIAAVPRGRVEVSVQQEDPRPAPRPEPGKGKAAPDEAKSEDDAKSSRKSATPVAKGVRIPKTYADAKQAGLGFDLAEPDQKYDINLK